MMIIMIDRNWFSKNKKFSTEKESVIKTKTKMMLGSIFYFYTFSSSSAAGSFCMVYLVGCLNSQLNFRI